MTGSAYEYVVLRCVPRAHREEFLNVGVVLHSQDADLLGAAWHLDADRLRALDPSVDPADLETALRFVDAVCAGDTDAGGEAARGARSHRFGYLKAPRSTVLRPGPVHGGITDDPRACLARLLDVYVR
ncbi:DUF3037 domain-containing protein [Nocardioides sp. CFH 31398]|uniref:DUF3037 domain-containing protein n=1 Tax=Nocardioides sp. CFH 31398 TaxID=2919579 RepID=UPI001F05CCA2|nr:DUF3037 domain-containing protein [Nocardioides sp. CFH 31398]MCH1867508.1 DUF3037 domain-containing protein [Nocardioides sp. CFH 31398]